ncbi:WD repeat-containing protein 61 [Hymenopellis radicata]|nr:WD repeat-containing protein 61 [Hymenopellis radicata]
MSLAFLHAHDCHPPQTDSIWGIAWTEADTVISTSADGSIRQWTSAGEPLAPSPNRGFPEAHTLGLTSLSVAPDGRAALFNSIEGLTCLWDLVSAMSAGDDIEPSWTVSLNPRGETYASAGASGNVTIHSAAPGEDFGRRLGTPDGKRVALSSESGQIYIFDLESESLTKTFTSHAMSVRDLAWSPDGNLLISASEDKRLVLHDVRGSGGEIASFTGHSSWVLSVDISPDNRLGLSGSADKTIKVWDIGARAAVSTVQENGEVWSVSWRPKGAGAFVSGGEDGVVRWWRGAGAAASTF